MIKQIDVSFTGGKKVEARIGDFTILTDQSPKNGGEGIAPEPFQLFLVSIATCTGIYALDFCQARTIPTEGMGLSMTGEWNANEKRFIQFSINLTLPNNFPEKYKIAIIRAMEQCTVKRHLMNPPAFVMTTT